jgi:hypothetical protein
MLILFAVVVLLSAWNFSFDPVAMGVCGKCTDVWRSAPIAAATDQPEIDYIWAATQCVVAVVGG